MTEPSVNPGSELVSPSCGAAASSTPGFCGSCGFNLAQARRLPRREDWERERTLSETRTATRTRLRRRGLLIAASATLVSAVSRAEGCDHCSRRHLLAIEAFLQRGSAGRRLERNVRPVNPRRTEASLGACRLRAHSAPLQAPCANAAAARARLLRFRRHASCPRRRAGQGLARARQSYSASPNSPSACLTTM